MWLSTKGRYGLSAVMEITASGQQPLSVARIAKEQKISEGYLEQLMRGLKKAGIVAAARGAKGGYTLGRQAAEITVGEVLEAVGESIEPVECAAMDGCGECDTAKDCRCKNAWRRLNDAVAATLRNMTLQSLLEDDACACGERARGEG